MRIMLESETWPGKSYFITLTYSDEHLGSPDLCHKDWAQFIKDFRAAFCQAKYCDISVPRRYKRFGKERSRTFKHIKQVMCGEYGDNFGRKHFHGILFNHSFSDIQFTGDYSRRGNPIHTSRSLEEVWGRGRVQVEELNWDLALYVGAYITDMGDDEDVNVGHKKKQYGLFGRGIGLEWLKKYWPDLLSAGCVMLRDRDYPIPRYFIKKMEEICPVELAEFRRKRLLQLLAKRDRLIVKGDGPLRRAKAKGRIFKHIHSKRRIDNGNDPGGAR